MASKISWTNETWNPVTGCSHVSDGCRFCYAERLSLRFGWSTEPWIAPYAAKNIRLHPNRLNKPRSWRTPKRVFVNSMSDLFHPLVPDDFIVQVFSAMVDLPQHVFQILTKRPERAATWPGPWPAHIWMGTSVEDERVVDRLDVLRACSAAIRFVSFEPLIGATGAIDLTGYAWAIAGGESGPGYRPMDHAWVRAIRDACLATDTAFFFKQDAGSRPELRPWVVEEDGTCWRWQQYPDERTPPEQVEQLALPQVTA